MKVLVVVPTGFYETGRDIGPLVLLPRQRAELSCDDDGLITLHVVTQDGAKMKYLVAPLTMRLELQAWDPDTRKLG
jgi:hypothetical protein